MRFKRREKRNQRINNEGELLVAKAEAFLSGSYLIYLHSRSEIVPNWAWINRIAHGDLHSIQAATTSADGALPPLRGATAESWRSAEGVLAVELLEAVDEDAAQLAHVQQNVLIPLELRLIERDAAGALTALELVQTTRSALRSISM